MSKHKGDAGPSLEAFAEQEVKARYAENQELARTARALRTKMREQEEELLLVKKKLNIYEQLDDARLEPLRWALPTRPAKAHVGIPCLELADVHWGAVIDPAEVDGINAYDLSIAEKRLRRTFEGAVRVSRDYLTGVEYAGIQVFLPGDMLSGEIHQELRETNAETITDSIMSLVEPMESGLRLLQEEFGKVKVACTVGNHGRRTKKPISKQRVRDNYDYLTYRMLARDFRTEPNIEIHISPAPDMRVELFDTRYILTHGDQFRGGSGISAELSPLLLGVHRKQRREAAVRRSFEIMVMGHFHRTLILPSNGLIVGGSIMGYDEFAFLNNFRPEPPQSAFWVTTPEHGVTFIAPIFAAQREKEGW